MIIEMGKLPKMPTWAAAGTFAEVWRETAAQLKDGYKKDMLRAQLDLLEVARVVTIDPEQVAVLPKVPRTNFDAIAEARLPFDYVYLSLGDLPHGTQNGFYVRGALLASTVFEQGSNQGMMWVVPYVYDCDNRAYLPPQLAHIQVRQDLGKVDVAIAHQDFRKLYEPLFEWIIWRIFDVLYFFESSNVELVEGEASRQERRHVARKGGRMALSVRIRPPRHRSNKHMKNALQPVAWSHRWEVRGHYMHFPVGTKMADSAPEKLVNHPTLGPCRRIWCPPHVKGPDGLPLVIKTRVVDSTR